ncbi:ArdC-like ssDNA-binding domain-containing protein [Vibrio vulnificus]
MATYTKSSTDFYQTITNQIIQALEAGIKPWVCPWDRTQATGLPINASTHQPYQGMNIMLLWMSAAERSFSSPYWLTFKQAKELGGKVRKGEKGRHLVMRLNALTTWKHLLTRLKRSLSMAGKKRFSDPRLTLW